MSQDAIYAKAGFGATVPRGTKPALLVVDFSYGFTDPSYPTGADMSDALGRTREIAEAMRKAGGPVVYTTIAYSPAERDRLAWLKKATGMADLLKGTRLVEIDERAEMSENDTLIVKHGASAFHGTNLAAFLTSAGVDTLVVAGATTSGCVRASVVDSVQSGFHTLVPRDGCADRAQAPHDANLYDMDQKYADVTDTSDILNWLASSRAFSK